MRSWRELNSPRRSSRRARIEKTISIWLSHEACLGVRRTVNLGCAASQARVAFETWDDPLSRTRWIVSFGSMD